MKNDYFFVSIFDKKSGRFSPPVAYDSRQSAIRSFIMLLAAGDSIPAHWPDDFDLYEVAAFDVISGRVTPLETPDHILTGQSAISMVEDFLRRQRKGGAVGETAPAVSPEDKAKPDGAVPSDDPADLSRSRSYADTPDMLNNKKK